MVAVSGSSCLVNSCKISHLGINPERGGRPPRDNKMRGVKAVRMGVLAQDVAKVFMSSELLIFSVRNIDVVMRIYMERASKVSLGLKETIKIIHPRWAMEE